MTERYLKERVYRVKQKLGGLEVFLKWSMRAGKEGGPAFLSFRLAGTVDGKLRAAQADLPASCLPDWESLGEKLREGKVPLGDPVLRYSGVSGNGKLWWLELSFLGEGLLKPWEFRLYTAEGESDLLLSEPIRVRVSAGTLWNLVEAVCCRAKS